jgi:glycosyltransferase involved in cell wall biosynthesis
MSGARLSAPPRVLVVAPFDHALNAHSILRCRALERLGCPVQTVNVLTANRWLRPLRRSDLAARVTRRLKRSPCDLVLVIGVRSFEAEDLAALRQVGGDQWVWWSPDPPLVHPELEAAMALYDATFMGGSDVAADLSAQTGRVVRHLPAGCDPSVHRPMRSRDRFRANVVFAGRVSRRREALLAEVVEFGLAVWGRGWRRTSLRSYCRGERVSDYDYIRAYAGASVALNIHRDQGTPRWSAGANQRVFELAAMGAAQVVDRRDDVGRHLAPGEEIAVFEDAAGLKERVRDLLHDPRAAEAMGQAARAAAMAHHTYMHRMLELVTTVRDA